MLILTMRPLSASDTDHIHHTRPEACRYDLETERNRYFVVRILKRRNGTARECYMSTHPILDDSSSHGDP